jgi:hypothetical protein
MRALANSSCADLVIDAGLVRTFDEDRTLCRSIAIRDDRVIALGERPGDLETLVGPATRRVDVRDLVLLPAFFDTHNHQLSAAMDLDAVDLGGAQSIADVVRLVAERARTTPAGRWVITGRCWHETVRTARVFPVRECVEEGALVGPGTESGPAPWDPLLAIWNRQSAAKSSVASGGC